MKKLFSFLAVVIINIVFCNTVFAQGTTIYLKCEAIDGNKTVNISLAVRDNFSISYLHLKIGFPLDAFSYENIQVKDCFEENSIKNIRYSEDLQTGYIEVEMGSADGRHSFNKDGELACITLKLKDGADAGEYTVTCEGFNNDKSDAMFSQVRPLNVKYENTTIEIKEDAIDAKEDVTDIKEEVRALEEIDFENSEVTDIEIQGEETACQHKWVYAGIIIQAGCEQDGQCLYICEYDNTHTRKETIGALGHKMEEKTVKKNNKNVTVLKCVRDGCDYVENEYSSSNEDDKSLSSDITTYSGADRTDAIILAIGFGAVLFIFSLCSFIKHKLDKK